jgi:Flp pilus assembly pilin Flp
MKQFWKDQNGLVAAEAVIMLFIIVVALVAAVILQSGLDTLPKNGF